MDARRLFHRWFVEYNPLYILSAALVLRGVNLMSHALTDAGRVYAQLGVPAIVELYAWALIAGAALLVRVGLRRPAVMLSLLAVVYQGDLTLHTETCAYLGAAGALASFVWLASFVLKLFALSKAMQLRVSWSAFAVPILGASALVVVPWIVRHVNAGAGSMVAGAALFSVFAAALWLPRTIESARALDDWGRKVLDRARFATWSIWAALAVFHVAFLFSQRAMHASVLAPLPLVLATRFIRRERWVWLAFAVALVISSPQFLAFTAMLCAISLALRAIALRDRIAPLALGVLFCVHLALWTAGWTGGAFPPHIVALDLGLAVVVVASAWKLRIRSPLAPLGAIVVHHLIQTRTITAPITSLEWGAWTVGAGFVMLVATIAATVSLRRNAIADP